MPSVSSVSSVSSVASVATESTPFDRVKATLEAQRKMLLVTALDHALTAIFDNGELFIEFAPESRHFRDTLAKAENVKFIRDACREVLGAETGLRIAVKDAQAENDALNPENEARLNKQRQRENAANDPVTHELVKKFRGEFVDFFPPDTAN